MTIPLREKTSAAVLSDAVPGVLDGMASDEPIASVDVSVVIPSCNRGAQVERSVERCLALRPRPREIVIVDDGSDRESADLLRQIDHPSVKYVRLPTNEGQSVARSIGLATARGRYLVSLDDDSWFLERDALQRVWDRLESLPRCGILALKGFSPGMPIEPPGSGLTLVADHITCGAAFRSEVLRGTGYHLGFLRYEGEESDLSLKVIDAGFDIVLDSSIRFFHDYNPAARSRRSLANVRRLAVRNDLLRSWVYLPLDLAIAVSAWRAVSHFVWGIRTGMTLPTLRGYLEFLVNIPRALMHRRPIRRAAALRYFNLRRKPQALSLG